MRCKHYWLYHHSLNMARCPLCRTEIQRAGPDPDGRWQLWKVAMRAAMRSVKHQSSTQAAAMEQP